MAVRAAGLGQPVHEIADERRFAVNPVMRGVEHQVVRNSGEFLINPSHNFAAITRIEIGNHQPDDLRPPPASPLACRLTT